VTESRTQNFAAFPHRFSAAVTTRLHRHCNAYRTVFCPELKTCIRRSSTF